MEAFLDQNEKFRELLFPRGFFMTDDASVDPQSYPFYGMWNLHTCGQYRFFVHPKQRLFAETAQGITLVLIGHGFCPIAGQQSLQESEMLCKAVELFCEDERQFHKYLNMWTGLFALFVLTPADVRIYGDAAGMYTVFYGCKNHKLYCSSHTNLLGDICKLEMDPYIKRLIGYRFYSLFGKSLPGDLSPYAQFKRLIPNHYVNPRTYEAVRFFPVAEDMLVGVDYDAAIEQSAQILSKSMELICQKWDRAAISLTGGCDSKTTLSCANGVYDRYSYFSYTSSDSESVDAQAAADICRMLKIPHKIYEISDQDEVYPDIEDIRKLMEYNSGSIGKNNRNDVRKRAFFLGIDDFDVEVKSWASEIARAYYHKRFVKKNFPKKLTPRYATTLYKVFITDRKLVRETDAVFAQYIKKYFKGDILDRANWYDLLFWEFRMSSWNGLVITGEQQIAYDIAIPYNNRYLLWYLLSTPVEKRAQDAPHWDIMRKMNPEIADCGISVVNVKHTNRRARMERLYLAVASKLPF